MLLSSDSLGKTNKKSLSNFNICNDKRHTHLLSFIIVFYCSKVVTGKNTKISKHYASLKTVISYGKKSWRSCSAGILTLIRS